MPIKLSTDHDRKLTRVKITGRLEVADAVDFIKLHQANGGPDHHDDGKLPLLVDATEAEEHKFLITEVDMFARLAEKIHRKNGHRREALVAGNDQNLGLLTLFRQFSANSANTRVFCEIDEALGWLLEPS